MFDASRRDSVAENPRRRRSSAVPFAGVSLRLNRNAGFSEAQTKEKKQLGRTYAGETAAIIKSLKHPRSLTEALEHYELRCYWYEVVECLRKVLMAGVITVLVPVGSYEQLVVGTIIGVILLGVLINQTPYKKRIDDILAIICQLAILIALQLGLLLKGMQDDQLIEYFFETDGVDPQEAKEEAEQATEDLEDAIGGLLIAMTVTPVVIAFVMAWTSFGAGRRAYEAVAACFSAMNVRLLGLCKRGGRKDARQSGKPVVVSNPRKAKGCRRWLTHPCVCLCFLSITILLLVVLLVASYAASGSD